MGSYIVERRFWKQGDADVLQARAILPIMKTLPTIIQAGVLVQVISGTLLLQSTSWVFWGQGWLSIKLVLVALAVANGIFFGKKIGGKIGMVVFSPSPDMTSLSVLKSKMKTYNIAQTILIVGILVLATVFR